MFLNINSNGTYPSNVLSNQTLHPFNFEDFQNIPCMESFLQSLKFENPEEQAKILYLSAEEAIAAGKGKAWDTYLFWKGEKINRFSKEYIELVTRTYRSLLWNTEFREALLASGHKMLLHTSGKTFRKNTVLTWWEFIRILTKLRKEAAQIDFAEDASNLESIQPESAQNESEESVSQPEATEDRLMDEKNEYDPFSAHDTYGNHMYRRPGERADVIFTTKTGEQKVIVDNDGRIMDFPGIKKEDFWMKEICGKNFLDPVIRFWTRFAQYDNERYIMYWQVQPDGRYWADGDGFGMEPDEEITLYAFIDQEGNFMGPFEIYQIGCKKYLE